MRDFLLIPNIQVHNANALSSPYTIGFPAMTAWLGAIHALQRHLNQQDYEEVIFNSTAVVCHEFDLQTYKGENDYVHSIIGTGNPLNKDGKRPSFIEEARIDLMVSLLIEVENMDSIFDESEFRLDVDKCFIAKMKLAGGDVLQADPAQTIHIENNTEERALLRKLMPGHCLIERRHLMTKAMSDGQDGIDALLDYLKIIHRSEKDDKEAVTWTTSRKKKGWIVPIATGFHGISELGLAESQRDANTPHRFAESTITLGEFVMPYRITELDHMLWHYHVNAESNLYLCQQNKPTTEL